MGVTPPKTGKLRFLWILVVVLNFWEFRKFRKLLFRAVHIVVTGTNCVCCTPITWTFILFQSSFVVVSSPSSEPEWGARQLPSRFFHFRCSHQPDVPHQYHFHQVQFPAEPKCCSTAQTQFLQHWPSLAVPSPQLKRREPGRNSAALQHRRNFCNIGCLWLCPPPNSRDGNLEEIRFVRQSSLSLFQQSLWIIWFLVHGTGFLGPNQTHNSFGTQSKLKLANLSFEFADSGSCLSVNRLSLLRKYLKRDSQIVRSRHA